MWRRIHSNRDPRDTLFSELQKEFSAYYQAAGSCLSWIFRRYPKSVFGSMIAMMALSLALSFTVFRQREKQVIKNQVPSRVQNNPVSDGFGQIMQVSQRIRETLKLKHLVDSITAKKQLTPTDSVALDSALDRLQHIAHHTK